MYKRKKATLANNLYYLSSNRHARTLCCSQYSDPGAAPSLTLNHTNGPNVTSTWKTQYLERKDFMKSFLLYLTATAYVKNRHETC